MMIVDDIVVVFCIANPRVLFTFVFFSSPHSHHENSFEFVFF